MEEVEPAPIEVENLPEFTIMMLNSALLERLPRLREIFPRPIIQEWSDKGYLAEMHAVDRRLLAALDRLDGQVDWLREEDELRWKQQNPLLSRLSRNCCCTTLSFRTKKVHAVTGQCWECPEYPVGIRRQSEIGF